MISLIKTIGSLLIRFFHWLGWKKGREEVIKEITDKSNLRVVEMNQAQDEILSKYDNLRRFVGDPRD